MRQDRDRRFIDRLPVVAMVLGAVVALLAVGAIATLAFYKGAPYPREEITNYYPAGAVSEDLQAAYAAQLNAMREPVLGAPRANAAKGVSELRVLVLPTFGHAAAVRYTFDKSGTQRRAIKLCRKDIGIDDTTTLAASESAALLASLDASGYWSMPEHEQLLLTDGTTVIVETVRDGERRMRVRRTPEDDSAARGLDGFVAFYRDAMQRGGVATASKVVDPVCR